MLSALERLVCLLAAATLAFNVQVPLTTSTARDEEWNLDKLPNPNATDHLVFETVYSLLQHWPNTRMRNGHNIVPGSIPKGTLLYHGTDGNKFPLGPDWVATDPEHSNLFCRGHPSRLQQGCWHLTLATTKPLKVVYFDGSSAVKMSYGSMDTQDLLAWGKVASGGMMEERERIRDLCKWGKGFGVDGFVRMEMDFEVMLCDFTSGVSIVSFPYLAAESSSHPPLLSIGMFEVMNAGSWHNRFPGETRIHLDLDGLVSFYDTQLVPSLVDIRFGQERWDHRVRNTSTDDIFAIKERLESILTKPVGTSSGIDWKILVQVIVDRYAGRLELMRHLMASSTEDPNEIIDVAKKMQTQLRIMLTPYILFSATPTDPENTDWANPIYTLCATTHTLSMESELDSMTDSEKLVLQAIRGTTREICRVITKMWAGGVQADLDAMLQIKNSPDIVDAVGHLWDSWKEDLTRLMAWLDWSVWIKCHPVCDLDEMCWLPTWPVGFPHTWRPPPGFPPPPDQDDSPHLLHMQTGVDLRAAVMESLAEQMWNVMQPGPDDWIRPQPRCVRRVGPYNM